ncbi:HEPN domain-containing protein [Lacinutrix venerupis]|uniref:Apea-like HEPN domain-containing protein n=1 Tax=Lacinutrix venerupis TaxID=1486034 RepID=A0AAC9LJT8_9FLAO|nr:HEPN domain-containing protein [Lacinutrix venerupis]APX99718.1 hypothetical protein BWR22_05140 [Lacinutrix venerupis]
MTTTINIYQSFIKPLNRDSENLKKEFTRSQRALKNLEPIELKVNETLTSVMEVEELEKLPDNLETTWGIHKRYQREEIVYHFKIKVSYEKQYFEDLEKEYGINSNDFFKSEILPDKLEKRFYDFLMILNICRVGGFHFGIGFFDLGDGYKQLKKMNLYTTELFDYSIEKKWPKFENLGIRKTWNWFITILNPVDIDELSSTDLSRAFNAFSYLYEESEEINKLFWTMVGIEAIYVKGKEGISQQIKEKGQLFLGEIEEFKKRLTKMYDYRSSFIHGSKNFPSFFHIDDAIYSYENFNTELFEILFTAESMLIATIQKIAKENRQRLNFKYVID